MQNINLFIIICFNGALTSKPHMFDRRNWELRQIRTVNFFDTILTPVLMYFKGLNILRISPLLTDKNSLQFISDKVRFSFDGFDRKRVIDYFSKFNGKWLRLGFNLFDNLILYVNKFFGYSNLTKLFYSMYSRKHVSIFTFFVCYMQLNLGEGVSALTINSSKKYYTSFSTLRLVGTSVVNKVTNVFNNDNLQNLFLNDLDFNKVTCFLIGVELRFDIPFLNLKLRNQVCSNRSRVFSFGNTLFSNYKLYNAGFSVKLLIAFLSGSHFLSSLIDNKCLVLSSYNYSNIIDLLKFSVYYRKYIFKTIFYDNVSLNCFLFNLVSSMNIFNIYKSSKFGKFSILSEFYTKISNFYSNSILFYYTSNMSSNLSGDVIIPCNNIFENCNGYFSIYGIYTSNASFVSNRHLFDFSYFNVIIDNIFNLFNTYNSSLIESFNDMSIYKKKLWFPVYNYNCYNFEIYTNSVILSFSPLLLHLEKLNFNIKKNYISKNFQY